MRKCRDIVQCVEFYEYVCCVVIFPLINLIDILPEILGDASDEEVYKQKWFFYIYT